MVSYPLVCYVFKHRVTRNCATLRLFSFIQLTWTYQTHNDLERLTSGVISSFRDLTNQNKMSLFILIATVLIRNCCERRTFCRPNLKTVKFHIFSPCCFQVWRMARKCASCLRSPPPRMRPTSPCLCWCRPPQDPTKAAASRGSLQRAAKRSESGRKPGTFSVLLNRTDQLLRRVLNHTYSSHWLEWEICVFTSAPL